MVAVGTLLVMASITSLQVPTVELAAFLQSGVPVAAVAEMLSMGMGIAAYERLSDAELRELGWPKRHIETGLPAGVWVAQPGEPGYPELLAGTAHAPLVLWGRGERDAVTPGVAVIGTREMTAIGAHVARSAVTGAALAGVPVISGLARGCDKAGHEAALEQGVKSVAVLGSGVDVVTPVEHGELAERILEAGGALLSEQPLGTPVAGKHLMLRNRIITGMSHVVVPCEGGPTSRGTLGAVGFAVAQERMIVVGRVKPSWRHYESAWLAERLATGSKLSVDAWKWPKAARERVARMNGPIANGVGEDRESIAELVEFAVRWQSLD